MGPGEISSLVVAVLSLLGALTAYLKAHTATATATAAQQQLTDHIASASDTPAPKA